MSVMTYGEYEVGQSRASWVEVSFALLERVFQQAQVPFEPGVEIPQININQVIAECRQQCSACLSVPVKEPLAAMAQVEAVQESLRQTSLMAHAMQALQQEQSRSIQAALQEARNLAHRGQPQAAMKRAKQAQTQLAQAVQHTCDRIADAQRHVVGEVMVESLQELGYQVERSSSEKRGAVWATRGAEAVAVLLESDGSFTMDMHGFVGTRCQKERAALISKLAEKGVELRVRQSALHGDRYGGQLLKSALQTARQQKIPVADALLTTAQSHESQQDLRRRQKMASQIKQNQ